MFPFVIGNGFATYCIKKRRRGNKQVVSRYSFEGKQYPSPLAAKYYVNGALPSVLRAI